MFRFVISFSDRGSLAVLLAAARQALAGAFKERIELLNIESWTNCIQPKIGSFSAVSTPIFATKCSFCSIFNFYKNKSNAISRSLHFPHVCKRLLICWNYFWNILRWIPQKSALLAVVERVIELCCKCKKCKEFMNSGRHFQFAEGFTKK